MKFFKALFLLLSLMAVISGTTSCKKELTPLQLLEDSKWKLTAETTDGKDSFAGHQACDLDDTMTTKAGGTLLQDEGATKCDATAPQTNTGTWSLSTDSKILTLKDDTGFGLPFTVITLNETTLVVEVVLFGKTVQTYTKQ
jgi:hypothetical protein